MKLKTTFSLFAFLLLAACGSDDPATDGAADEAGDLPAIVDTAPEEPVQAAPAAEDEAEIPQAVEESGGEPDAEDDADKPIILAQADTASTSSQDWQFQEGTHFYRMVPTQPTVGGSDKIEVAEFFWYGCGHCFEFETYINKWSGDIPPNVRFVRVPATWNPLVELHAQLYYTEEVLVNNGKISNPEEFRASVFAEYHRRGNRMTSMNAIKDIFTRVGVSEEDFDNTWGSFEVSQKLRVAKDLARRYAITGVPAMVVNGKYRTGKAESGTYPKLLEIVDELVDRETVR